MSKKFLIAKNCQKLGCCNSSPYKTRSRNRPSDVDKTKRKGGGSVLPCFKNEKHQAIPEMKGKVFTPSRFPLRIKRSSIANRKRKGASDEFMEPFRKNPKM